MQMTSGVGANQRHWQGSISRGIHPRLHETHSSVEEWMRFKSVLLPLVRSEGTFHHSCTVPSARYSRAPQATVDLICSGSWYKSHTHMRISLLVSLSSLQGRSPCVVQVHTLPTPITDINGDVEPPFRKVLLPKIAAYLTVIHVLNIPNTFSMPYDQRL